MATDRQQRVYDIVREHHVLLVTISRVERRNSALSDALRAVPKFAVGGWMWVYKVLAVGPSTPADAADGSPLCAKLLYLDLPSDMPGADARRRVSVQLCKSCASPHDRGDMPKYFCQRG